MNEDQKMFLEKCDAMKKLGYSDKEIANSFNFTVSAYRKKRSMLRRMKWNEEHDIPRRLREAGFSDVEITVLCRWKQGVSNKDF